jgi:hypothetical protein
METATKGKIVVSFALLIFILCLSIYPLIIIAAPFLAAFGCFWIMGEN